MDICAQTFGRIITICLLGEIHCVGNATHVIVHANLFNTKLCEWMRIYHDGSVDIRQGSWIESVGIGNLHIVGKPALSRNPYDFCLNPGSMVSICHRNGEKIVVAEIQIGIMNLTSY